MAENVTVPLTRSDFLVVFLLVLYIAQIPSPLLQAAITTIIALYVLFSLLRGGNTAFQAMTLPKGHLLVALTVYGIYTIFSLRASVHQENIMSLPKAVLYGSTHLLFYFAVQLYGSSKGHSVRLMRAFATALLISLALYAVGLLFPLHLFAFRYLLYGNIFDQLESEGLLSTGALGWSAGLAPYLHLFGYQVTAGAAFVLAMFMTSSRRRIAWGALTLFSCAMVIILAQRSILPALAAALIMVLRFRLQDCTGIREGGINTRRLALMFVIISTSMVLAAGIMAKYYQDEEVKLVQERVGADDLWIRLGMQVAAVEIIATHPAGLIMDGLAEEDWGGVAESRGYEVVPDANQVDYALVHNAYLRIIMYLGWTVGVLILVIFIYMFRRISSLARSISHFPCEDIGFARYFVAAATVFVALLVQSLFHNDSIFTFERTSWASLCILLATLRHLPEEAPAR